MKSPKLKRSDLAAALGIDPSLVTRYVRRGMPVHSVEAAQAWKTENVRPRVKAARQGQSGLFDYDDARARREHWAAQKAEIEARRAAGELVEVTSMEAAFAQIGTTTRVHLEGMVHRLAPGLVGLSETDIRRAIEGEVRGVLAEIARVGARLADADERAHAAATVEAGEP